MYNEAEKQYNLFSQSHTVHITLYHATSYSWPRGRTHRHTDTHTRIHLHRSDFKKPGACGRRAPGLKMLTLILDTGID